MSADTLFDGSLTLQELIDSGIIWRLEGSAGRTAMLALEVGHCTLGVAPSRDFYGNRIPARSEVKPGTLGSLEYAEDFHDPETCPFCEEQ